MTQNFQLVFLVQLQCMCPPGSSRAAAEVCAPVVQGVPSWQVQPRFWLCGRLSASSNVLKHARGCPASASPINARCRAPASGLHVVSTEVQKCAVCRTCCGAGSMARRIGASVCLTLLIVAAALCCANAAVRASPLVVLCAIGQPCGSAS